MLIHFTMTQFRIIYLFILFFLVFAISDLSGQTWTFVKEKDQIRIYTRPEANTSLKSFMGIMEIQADIEAVSAMIGNPKDLEWWGKEVKEIKLLTFEKDRHIQYYLVYDSPWPFSDRDLVGDVRIVTDSLTGIRTVSSLPLQNVIPENPDLVRVKDFRQKWTLHPLSLGVIRVTLEGYIDPAGSIPAWLYNMIVIDTPLKLMREIQKRVEK
jgi:hypothetical protein